MSLFLSWALLVSASLSVSAAMNVPIERGVYTLNAAAFETMVNKYPVVMVKFYSPGCGHCKAMAPAYEKAGRKLRTQAQGNEHGLRLAKVDATVETDLAQKFDISGVPTVLVFQNGNLFGEYSGGQEKADYINYMTSMTMPWPVGSLRRIYIILDGVYQNIVPEFLPDSLAPYRHYVRAAFPLVALGPLLMVLVGCVFFKPKRAGQQLEARSRPQEKPKRPAGRTSSPAPKKEASQEASQGEQTATEKNDNPKDVAEKKKD